MSPRILKRVAREPGVLAESDCWRTPRECFLKLHEEFSFVIDLAADAENSHMGQYYIGPGSAHPDALSCDWFSVAEEPWGNWHPSFPHPWGFLNPPYSAHLIGPFVEQAVEQTLGQNRRGFGVVALLPDTHDTRWYRHLRWAAEIRRIPHRVPYLKADGTTKAGAMFPSCVAIFRPQPGVRNPQPRVVEWTWRVE